MSAERSIQPTASPAQASPERLRSAQSSIKAFFEFRAMVAFTLFKTDWLPDEVYLKSNYTKD